MWHGYGYNQLGYTKSGKEKRLEFTALHNLRHEAYLKLTYNKHKGVTDWQEVKKSEVPQKALDKI